MNHSNNTVTLAFCLNGSACDLFFWSRSPLNALNRISFKSQLNEYCKVNEDDFYISDLSADLCQSIISPNYLQSNVNSCNITSNDQEFDLNQVEKNI